MLRMSYGHAQMMLYRPFLHYVSQTRWSKDVDQRSYACAAACVSVSRNIVHIAIEMKKRGLLQGAYWFTMYTTFFAILSLVFYALENPDSDSSQEVLASAIEAKNALEALARRSLAADRCASTLKVSHLITMMPCSITRLIHRYRVCSSNFLSIRYHISRLLPRRDARVHQTDPMRRSCRWTHHHNKPRQQ